ncbi:Vacuolar protein sorting-associated protein atg6 [Zalaria obscura]|uniref:Vacuolar protein sorting-associated protein atg6 n=1 Tax=Zalaria obscura TaxID=2024903 RepID=A0ACC3SPH5_9PEZI
MMLDGSLEHLNPASFKILTGNDYPDSILWSLILTCTDSAPTLKPQPPQSPKTVAAKERENRYHEAAQHAGPPQHKRSIPAPQRSSLTTNPAMSFVMLSQSQIHTPEDHKPSAKRSKEDVATKDSPEAVALSQRLERNLRLFEILSARSDIDHPVCSECTDLLLTGLQQRQAAVNRERDAYIEFLKKAQEDVPSEEEQQRARQALAAAKVKEQKALEELEELEATKAALEDEIATLDAEGAALDEEEEAFWSERNAFDLALSKYREERDALQNQLAQDTKLLEQLQRTNVYNDSFCIGHDGWFGTINGLRLGRLPDHPVDWPEINAAWGQTLLLLSVVAEKLDFTFEGYRLLPIGSASKIERLEYPQGASAYEQSRTIKPKVTQFDLFCSGDMSLGLGFFHRGFDNAMVAFLECLRQLGEHVERTSSQAAGGALVPGLKMPYKISKDKIGEASIKLGSFKQGEDIWTKACKYTLTCCKFLLAHASHVDDVQGSTKSPR